MLTTHKVIRALKSIPRGGVTSFIERHELPARTVYRLRDSKRGNANGGHAARESTIRRIAQALATEGVLSVRDAQEDFKPERRTAK